MDAVNKRAFSRTDYEAPIMFAYSNSDIYYDASMLNSSQGGMYIETSRALMPGSEIYIKIVDFPSVSFWEEENSDFCGSVVWCMSLNKKSGFGAGVRFLVNVCDQCGEKIPWKSIQKIDNYIHLCPECSRQLNALSTMSRNSIENYLLGNVI